MRVGILGPLLVTAGEVDVRIGGARLRALLIRLALEPSRVVSTESLTRSLWPNTRLTDSTHALQALVSRLRQTLPEPGLLERTQGGYRLRLPPTSVDVTHFEQLRQEGQRRLREGDAARSGRVLREALTLWRGEPLVDVQDMPFATQEVTRLTELRLTALEDRIAADLACGATDLVAELEALTASYPLRERLYALLVRALHADGRQSEALRRYAGYRRLLADQIGSDPGPELRAAHLAVLRDDRDTDGNRSNLGAPLTSFVGRTEERRRIHGQLRERRLVTLVGTGGVGKTRLATTIAAELADRTPDGVWLISLATATVASDVPQILINILGVRQADRPVEPVRALVAALGSSETLLIMDNCEHVIAEAARVVERLLVGCPRLRVIATSREPLMIPGETLSPVPPLPVPPTGAPVAQAMEFPSVQLLVERARAASPTFSVTEENIGHIVETCRRLDGLPLAIELAGARLRSMSIQHLATRLDDRFRLLTGGSRTALSRHQTLHAAVTWSWDLLNEPERRALRNVSIFPGSFDAAAAESLGVAPELLDVLFDRSLIALADCPEPRYVVLETIREYAFQRLEEAGEVLRLRRDHATHFLALAERAAPHLRGPEQHLWMLRLNAESGNLLAALRFATDFGDADTSVRIAAALWYAWVINSEHTEATERLRRALSVPGLVQTDRSRTAAIGLLFSSVLGGDHDAMRDARHWAIDSGMLKPDEPLAAALLALTSDDPGPASASDRPETDSWEYALLWWIRSFLSAKRGEPADVCDALTRAEDGFRRAGDRWALAMCLLSMSDARLMVGDLNASQRALEESTELAHGLGSNGQQRLWLAVVRLRTADVRGARAELLSIVEAPPNRYASTARIFLADLCRQEGDLDAAARQLRHAANDREAQQDLVFRSLYRLSAGHLAVACGDLHTAARDLREGLDLIAAMPHVPMGATVGAGVAALLLNAGSPAAAAEVLGASRALTGTADADVLLLERRLGEQLDTRGYQDACSLEPVAALALIQRSLADTIIPDAGRQTRPTGRRSPVGQPTKSRSG
ncbi:BTAD domain-containing putative transcriptional regulator [Solwaraspora sp. WMMA2056]|uniref:ATP-binding protein n=1 Tax=Solwaraspora sp. WMMA2056 TaxID=3015161 RepID=UPI00259B01C2|nr:BTAD domain-containing putative transcriptional regulator [Solwaraspora sp. WMMA2056]WJK41321.1 BTAD domain-containing putative transcriptional regulator [Solwaraspora sp. WMMA2056]